jgi:hypothetical protein
LDSSFSKVKDDFPGLRPPPREPTHISGLGTVPGAATQQNASAVPAPQGLLVSIAATHAGIITRNNGFYLPDRMRKGATTFTKDFNKPVLLHHEDHKDPVGRIHEASYRDTSGSIVDKYKGLEVKNKAGKVIGTISDALIRDFNSGTMPFAQQIDVTRSLFRDSLLEDEGYEGLGHIQLVANITDLDAVQKLLDGRYLTGSVGATTDSAVCSICRVDWTDSGMCEHKPGAVYDGAKCFVIAGNLVYDEYSFVNVPADRHSRVLQLHYNGIQDSVACVDTQKSRIYEVNLEFPQYMEDNKMTATGQVQITDSAATSGTTVEVTNAVDTQTLVTDGTVGLADNAPADPLQVAVETVQDSVPAPVITFDSLVEKLLSADGVLTDEEHETLYGLMWNEVVDCAKSGVLIMDQKGLEDAKLSTEKRKSLPKSSFCGPDKSFPVPDCAHVTAARRLIGRYKGPGDKSAILSCVARKAKAMGCESKDEVQDSTQLTGVLRLLADMSQDVVSDYTQQVASLTDADKTTLVKVLKSLAGVVDKTALLTSLTEAGYIKGEKDLLDEIARNEETIGSLRERVKAMQDEYNSLFEDLQTVQDSVVKEKTEKRKVKEAHLGLLTALKDTKVESHDFTSLSDAVLDQEVTRLAQAVDVQKITDKLGDGMARQPTEVVANPIAITDATQDRTVADLAKIEEHYMYLRFTRGEAVAEAYLSAAMRRAGKLPQNATKS